MDSPDRQTEWDGYSIYAKVSAEIHDSVTSAIDAYAAVAAAHSEDAKVSREDASDAKAAILGAAMRFVTELELRSSEVGREDFGDVLDDWTGEGGTQGHIERLRGASLQNPSDDLDWLQAFVSQIHEVAYRLGYVAAGREETVEDNSPEATATDMLADVMPNATS